MWNQISSELSILWFVYIYFVTVLQTSHTTGWGLCSTPACAVYVFVADYCLDMFQPKFLAISEDLGSFVNAFWVFFIIWMESARSITWTDHVPYLSDEKYAERRLFYKGIVRKWCGSVNWNSLVHGRNELRVLSTWHTPFTFCKGQGIPFLGEQPVNVWRTGVI
jgi:hypothetical protein